jgi:hypothetical protein
MTEWPGANAYTVAIQNPQACFRDADLKAAQVARLALTGMPKVWSGNYAQVYDLESAAGRWAVKCFTRSARDLRARYKAIAAELARTRLPFFVPFEFLDDEMLVDGMRYPVVKMRWAEGPPLDQFVAASLGRPRTLLVTAARVLSMVRELERRGLAHGDLQHGNVVIGRSGVVLVDYDGMFVPAFAGRDAPEAGLACYQHPGRAVSDYGVGLDRFSALVICTAAAALADDPTLWERFGTGDNLLFTSADFRAPAQSRLFDALRDSGEPDVRTLARALAAACTMPPLDVPLPDLPVTFLGESRHDFFRVGDGNGGGALGALSRWLNRTYRIRVHPRRWNAPDRRP